MKKQHSPTPPITCTLTGNNLQERLAAILALTRDALQGFERRGLVLDLSFAGRAAARVREIVREERDCCGFLRFDLREVEQEVRLRITAPEEAREAADFLFEQFVGPVEQTSLHIAVGKERQSMKKPLSERQESTTEKAARAAAIATASGVLVCGVCCLLPIAIPAITLAGTGSIIAWLGGAQGWAIMMAAFVVAAAWVWVGLQSILAKAKPARTTLYMMLIATVILILGLLWPRIEPLIVTRLKA
jgi:hypothetical protein